METLNVEALNEVKKELAARFEHVSREGIRAAREGSAALKKAYATQCKTDRELLRKATDLFADLPKIDPARRLRALGKALATTGRKSADTWLGLAEFSLGRARKVLQSIIEERPTA